MFTVDVESVNGGIYAMGTGREFASVTSAQAAVRRELRTLSCYWQVFITDAATGRRVLRGVREGRRGRQWSFYEVYPLTRAKLRDLLMPLAGTVTAEVALAAVDEHGETVYVRRDAYGPLRYRGRRYDDGTYALDKIPG